MSKKKVPEFKTDKEAEEYLEQDLSDLDFSQFKPARFEKEPNETTIEAMKEIEAGKTNRFSSTAEFYKELEDE